MIKLIQDWETELQNDLKNCIIEQTGIEKYEDICVAGSRIGGWCREFSDIDAIIFLKGDFEYSPKKENIHTRYTNYHLDNIKLCISRRPIKDKENNIWRKKFKMPLFSLVTHEITNVYKEDMLGYVAQREKRITIVEAWTRGRDYSRIIG